MITPFKTKQTICAVAITSVVLPLHAEQVDTFGDMFAKSNFDLNFRYRYEHVDQDSIKNEAKASTLKTRLTWKSAAFNNFSTTIEVDNVLVVGADDYNDTHNGKTDYPVVADPKGTDLNQIYLSYKGEKGGFTGGRQRILHNNQRFVGGVGWRQNEQTYDGLRVSYAVHENVSFDYSYVVNVNRIFGPDDGAQPADWEGDFHFINSKWKVAKKHNFSAFAYFLDNEDNVAASSNTLGFDYSGDFDVFVTNVSYAVQTDAGDNMNDYSANYYKAEFVSGLENLKLIAGIEILGSDNGVGFATPLATLHAFQGFADQFLSTPGNGVEDFYITAKTKLKDVNFTLTYHDFSSSKGSINYGSEIDLTAAFAVTKKIGGLVKFASYDAKEHNTDTTKIWLMGTFKF
ncbi:alginate export family protein [Thalassotalea fusca]